MSLFDVPLELHITVNYLLIKVNFDGEKEFLYMVLTQSFIK